MSNIDIEYKLVARINYPEKEIKTEKLEKFFRIQDFEAIEDGSDLRGMREIVFESIDFNAGRVVESVRKIDGYIKTLEKNGKPKRLY